MTDERREGEVPDNVILTAGQATRIMCLATMLKEKDLDFRGYEEGDCQAAREAIQDIAEECALQMGGGHA